MNTNTQKGHNDPSDADESSLEDCLLDAIRESYAEYNEHGARSSKKLGPLHQWVADAMQDLLETKYDIHSLRKDGDGCEKRISGKYYEKTVDVSISRDNVDLGIISIKLLLLISNKMPTIILRI